MGDIGMVEYGSWFTRTSAGGKLVGVVKYKDGDGRWRQRSKTFSRDAAQSVAEFARWRAEVGAAGAGPTVAECVIDSLASDLARGRIERSTHDVQMGYARVHIAPTIGAAPVASLTAAAVEDWADSALLDLSPASARICWNVLRKACTRARRRGLLASDPFEGAAPPRAPGARPSYLDARARAALEEAMASRWGAGSACGTAALLALYAGLRCGECCALRWRDVAGGEVRVRASVGRSAAGGYLKAPKSPASARALPCIPRLEGALAARREAVRAAGDEPDGSWFVCGEGGAFPEPKAVSRAFSRICEAGGIRDNLGNRATFHVLRHTFATVAVAAGVDVKTLSAMLGHASAKMTLDVYAAPDGDARRAGAARLAEAFG